MARPKKNLSDAGMKLENETQATASTEEEFATIDPAEITNSGPDDSSSQETKKQRKKRGPNKAKSTASKADLSGIASMLAFGTGLLADKTRIPEFGLSLQEAEGLDRAFTGVANLYDFPIFGEQSMAWVNLGVCISAIAGTHYVQYKGRTSQLHGTMPRGIGAGGSIPQT